MNQAASRFRGRVAFEAPVSLRAAGQSLPGEAKNLSPSGMFVAASELWQVGTELECELPLPEGPRTLRGRVAWVRPPSRVDQAGVPGMGIEFLDLSSQEEEFLRGAVGGKPEGEQSVNVWFEGLAVPLPCAAVLTEEGFRLGTGLSFLRIGSEVKIAYARGGERHDEVGVVNKVALRSEPGVDVPHLDVQVMVPKPVPVAKVTPLTMLAAPTLSEAFFAAAPPEADPAVDPASPLAPEDFEAAPRFARSLSSLEAVPRVMSEVASYDFKSAPVERRARQAAIGLGTLVVFATLFWVAHSFDGAPRSVAAPTATGTTHVSAPDFPTREPVTTTPAMAAPAAEPPQATEVPLPSPSADRGLGAKTPAPKASAALVTATATAIAPTGAPVGDGPRVRREGGRAHVVIPLAGSTEGASSYELADHSGVGINLPHAEAKQPTGIFNTDRDGFRQIWIEKRPTKLHLRFLFQDGRAPHVVKVGKNDVRVEVDVPGA